MPEIMSKGEYAKFVADARKEHARVSKPAFLAERKAKLAAKLKDREDAEKKAAGEKAAAAKAALAAEKQAAEELADAKKIAAAKVAEDRKAVLVAEEVKKLEGGE